jgi:sterol desaturase/sphingolipid hydroxylase (fatty acid hydroxylase superfamily)
MSTIDLPALLVWLFMGTILVVVTVRAAVPAGHKRKVPAKVLAQAVLPRRILRSPSGRMDIAAFLFSVLLAGMTLGWALVSATFWLELGAKALGPAPTMAVLPAWVGIPLVTFALFFAYDAVYWFNHWLSHKIPWLWSFHKVHHSAESLSVLTNFRVHPIDTILFYNMASCVIGLTGAVLVRVLGPVPQIGVGGSNAIVFVSSILLSYLQHSQLWITLPGRLGSWLLSPAHHQLHHSTDPRHYGCNLGSTLSLFDWMAGTLLRPTRQRQNLRFGVDDLPVNPHSLHGALLYPFVEAAMGPPNGRDALSVEAKVGA